MSHIIACSKSWCSNLANELNYETKEKFVLINTKNDLIKNNIIKINPKYIFFPHWSHIVSKDIYENFNCIIFHMTDLPYGRGGSPLQNLIIKGHKKTMISAIKCSKEIDAGPIYLKKELILDGNAREIFNRAGYIIKGMILEILLNNPKPKPQEGVVVKFKRRSLEDGNLKNAKNLNEVYNYIRMLDADEYPQSFISSGDYLFEFSDASIVKNEVIAKVKIKRQKHD